MSYPFAAKEDTDCINHYPYYDIDMTVTCFDCGEFLGTWDFEEIN